MDFFSIAQNLFLSHGIQNCSVLPGQLATCVNEKKWPDFPVKSVVLALFPYFNGWNKGNLCTYASQKDYHLVCGAILADVCQSLKKLYPQNSFFHFCDNSPIDELSAAVQSGLGVRGLNNLLISKDYGSLCFIGEILCDIETKTYPPPLLNLTCEGCQKCIEACPTGALHINEYGTPAFFKHRCLSYITQQKGELDAFSKDVILKSGMIWGCDACQKACPHNQAVTFTHMPDFLSNKLTELSAKDIEGLSNKEFKEKYKEYAFTYKGKALLLRNILLTQNKK